MDVESAISTTVASIIGLAIVAVLVSNRANTAKVIGASGSSLASVIGAAVSPVTSSGSSYFPPTLTSISNFGAANN